MQMSANRGRALGSPRTENDETQVCKRYSSRLSIIEENNFFFGGGG